MTLLAHENPRPAHPNGAVRALLLAAASSACLLAAPVLAQNGPGDGSPPPVIVANDDDRAVTEADRLFRLEARIVSVPPRIDGVLDEPEWDDAEVLTEFTQSQPNEGAPATERTEVRLLYDGNALYIAARMYESDPGGIVATVLRRDESHNDNDAFAVTFDTYHDHRNGYFFETNPLGAKFDAQIIGEGGISFSGAGSTFNRDWDAVWQAAGRINEDGWTVELAIPFWVLRFDRDAIDAWGINFRRTIRRKTEQSYWAPVPRQFNATRLSLSGMLVGMQSVDRPKNLRMKPFLRGDVGQLPDGPEADPFSSHFTDPSGDLGLDVKWTPSANVTVDGTLNTDFAQVEADDVQVNLTRFPLFFPEKREFFLENAGLFQFGSSSGRGGPRVIGFHSRRIGIFDGEEVPIIGGARVTGTSGGWNYGMLNLQTNSVNELELPSENHSVVRVRRELGSRSSAGVLFTNRQSGDAYNRTLGVDGRWAINPSTTIDGWWMTTRTDGLEGDSESAGAVNFEWAVPEWRVLASAIEVGDVFNPELGFVNRTDMRSYNSTLMWTPFFPESTWLRNLQPHHSFAYVTDRTGRLLSRYNHFDWDMFLKRGDKLSIAHNRYFERLDLPFEIVPGVVIPVGDYSYNEMILEAVSDPSRPVYGSVLYTWGTYWDGTYQNWNTFAGFRVGARFSTRVGFNRTDAELQSGDFTVDIWSTRISYDFNTRLFLSGLFQYDTLSDRFLTNLRLNFIHTPGADLFLVYNERRLTEDPTLIDRAVILKITQLFRL